MKSEMMREIDTGKISMDQLHAAARYAAMNSWSQMLPVDDRLQLAWEAIAEEVIATQQRITFNHMVNAGIQAIDHESRDWLRHNGRNNSKAFATFWIDWIDQKHCNVFADEVCQRLALDQILRVMPERLRRALIALAVSDDLQQAAKLLDQHYDTVTRNVREARAFVYALWFEDQLPPRVIRDRRAKTYATKDQQYCKQGHELVPENTYRVGISGRCCRTCQIQRAANRRAAQKANKRQTA